MGLVCTPRPTRIHWSELINHGYKYKYKYKSNREYHGNKISEMTFSEKLGQVWADLAFPSVCVCLQVWVYPGHIIHHYAGIWATCAPGRRNMHHGAQGGLCFLKNSGDPDDFLFWYVCLSVYTRFHMKQNMLQVITRWRLPIAILE